MAILPLLLTLAVFGQTATKPAPMVCIKSGEAYDKANEIIDYKGIRYGTCCPGCAAPFMASPDTLIAQDVSKKLMVGTFLFDPISGLRIDAKDSKATTDYKSVRYYFATSDEKKAFDTNPKKYTATPARELLHCPVEDSAVKGYASAGGFVDVNNVRYYTCCGDCVAMIKKDPAKYTTKFASQATAPLTEKI